MRVVDRFKFLHSLSVVFCHFYIAYTKIKIGFYKIDFSSLDSKTRLLSHCIFFSTEHILGNNYFYTDINENKKVLFGSH